jgi:hypothetical protein
LVNKLGKIERKNSTETQFMKIKSILVALLALVFTPTFANFAEAGPVTVQATPVVAPARNPERIADAMLLGKEIVAYQGSFGFYRDVGDGNPCWIRGAFVMDLSGAITSLNINDVEVPIAKSKPLKGLPANTKGRAVDFNAWIYGVDVNWNQVTYGSFYTRLWNPGDPVSFSVLPSYTRAEVPFKAPPGVKSESLQLQISSGDGHSYNGYNSYDGTFSVWLDPLVRSQDYSIVDTSTGVVLQRGKVDSFRKAEPSTDSPVSVSLAEGVIHIPINETNTSASFQSVQFATQVVREGKSYPARVFYTDLKGSGLALEFYNLPKDQGVVEVYEVTADGERLAGRQTANNWTTLAIPEYLGKVRIVIIGASEDSLGPWGMMIWFYQFDPRFSFQFNERG